MIVNQCLRSIFLGNHFILVLVIYFMIFNIISFLSPCASFIIQLFSSTSLFLLLGTTGKLQHDSRR